MRSEFTNLMPPKLRRALAKLGADIALARRKRRLTVIMMAERIGTGRLTYLRVEKGDPKVSMGVYAMALFVLGFSDPLAEIADPRSDDTGLLLDAERQPKRVRAKKTPTAL
jgi:DNA-binding XRE family transcriptional regulator